MKQNIRKYIPTSILTRAKVFRNELEIVKEFAADWREYRQFIAHDDAQYVNNIEKSQLETQLTKDYHRIEKGLALSAPKRPFGKEVAKRLQTLLPVASSTDQNGAYVRYAQDALLALETWNNSGIIDDHISPINGTERHGITKENLEKFFITRKSIRNFSDTAPSQELLSEAIRLASFTPSVCNRQSARVHMYTSPSQVASILAHQNGNAGFREQVPAVAIITTDRRLFSGKTERNQRWVDGGLFAMSFVWALHGLGVGSCMLNWSMSNQQTRDLREAAAIPPWEDIIVLVACGEPAPAHRYARSPRRSQAEIATFH